MLLATIQREWRIVLGAAGTFGLLTLASGILFGFGQWALFLDSVNEPNWTLPSMVNWMGLAWRVAPASQPLIQQVALPVFALAGLALGARVVGSPRANESRGAAQRRDSVDGTCEPQHPPV